jgi:hypothetical protein
VQAHVGFYVEFARWQVERYSDLPTALKPDFVADSLQVVAALAPILDTLPTKITLGTVLKWAVRLSDPLAPVRERIRAMKLKWAA